VQIVSYTADNGGYKADVRYEEDKEVTDNLVHENVISTTQRPLSVYQNEKSKLGRIVVPSQEEKDSRELEYVEYFYYYDDDAHSSTPRSPNYVTNENKELLITSKPGYIYTPTANPLKTFTYQPDSKYVVTPTPVPYVTSNRIEASTSSPKKYLHFYDAESVKFVSTTPNYYHVSSSTPVPHFHKYNHLNSLGSRAQSSSPPSTTPAPQPPYRGIPDTKPVTEDPDTVGLGRYYNPRKPPPPAIDFRKYFTFNGK
jgi:hypothetical protein